jgi:catechol 2,3-dioxygenase-like lactoylglutathione lyase family enzyme
MPNSISAVALVVRDYDEAIHFFTLVLRFTAEPPASELQVMGDGAPVRWRHGTVVNECGVPGTIGTSGRSDRWAGVSVPPDRRFLAGLPRDAWPGRSFRLLGISGDVVSQPGSFVRVFE